jgi:hypothetical protein
VTDRLLPAIPPEALLGDDAPPFTDADLEAYMGADQSDPTEPNADPVARWHIDGTRTAAWAMARLAQANAEWDAINAEADEFIRRIEEWRTARTAGVRRTAEFFANHLTRYALDQRAAGGDKTLSLPNGKVATRVTKARSVIDDPERLLAWAREYAPDMVVTTEKVPAASLAQLTVLEVPVRAVMAQCGCIVPTMLKCSFTSDIDSWTVGSFMVCPQCGQDALVGQWHETTLLAFGPGGSLADGVVVEAERVTAKPIPAGPVEIGVGE